MGTRATLYVVTEKEVISSTQFNGDGYPSGYGALYIEMMENVKSVDDFINLADKFNSLTFEYPATDLIYYESKKKFFKRKIMDMNGNGKNDYFDLYNSDWIFIKNLTNEPFAIKTRDEEENDESGLAILHPSEQIALNWGRSKGAFVTKKECYNKYKLSHSEGEEIRELVLSSLSLVTAKNTSSCH